jgi:hypothetical protein
VLATCAAAYGIKNVLQNAMHREANPVAHLQHIPQLRFHVRLGILFAKFASFLRLVQHQDFMYNEMSAEQRIYEYLH